MHLWQCGLSKPHLTRLCRQVTHAVRVLGPCLPLGVAMGKVSEAGKRMIAAVLHRMENVPNRQSKVLVIESVILVPEYSMRQMLGA